FRFLRPGPLTVAAPGVLANDHDAGGDQLYAELGKKTVHGALQLRQDGSFVYSPGRHFRSGDSFSYRAFDGFRRSKLVRVQIVAVAANTAPVGQPDVYSTPENVSIDITAPGVLSNDTDADGDPLRAELLSEPGATDDFQFRPDGSFLFQPVADWDSDLTFRYRITDGIAYSDPVTVTIDIGAVNNPPIGEDDSYEFDRTQGNLVVPAPGVLANDGDPVEFDAVHVWDHVSGPGHGQLTLRTDGSFTYIPDAGFVGTDGFAYRPGDSGPGNVTNVTIVVTDGDQ
ncbi:MAG: Ig-like domain-containing protein, partial [Actinomycetota bacterium]